MLFAFIAETKKTEFVVQSTQRHTSVSVPRQIFAHLLVEKGYEYYKLKAVYRNVRH